MTETKLAIPLHPDLRAILEQTQKEHVAILATARGAPFSEKDSGVFAE